MAMFFLKGEYAKTNSLLDVSGSFGDAYFECFSSLDDLHHYPNQQDYGNAQDGKKRVDCRIAKKRKAELHVS